MLTTINVTLSVASCIGPSFGLDLSSVFESRGQKALAVVLKCIEAVESRGEGGMEGG